MTQGPAPAVTTRASVAAPEKQRRQSDAEGPERSEGSAVPSARLGSPLVQQRRAHPATADGHRPRLRGARSTRVFADGSCWNTEKSDAYGPKLTLYVVPRNTARSLSEYRHHGAHRCREDDNDR